MHTRLKLITLYMYLICTTRQNLITTHSPINADVTRVAKIHPGRYRRSSGFAAAGVCSSRVPGMCSLIIPFLSRPWPPRALHRIRTDSITRRDERASPQSLAAVYSGSTMRQSTLLGICLATVVPTSRLASNPHILKPYNNLCTHLRRTVHLKDYRDLTQTGFRELQFISARTRRARERVNGKRPDKGCLFR